MLGGVEGRVHFHPLSKGTTFQPRGAKACCHEICPLPPSDLQTELRRSAYIYIYVIEADAHDVNEVRLPAFKGAVIPGSTTLACTDYFAGNSMADQDHGQVRVRLAKLDEHLNEAEQSLARSALMWLHVAQRPLCAHELWMALQIEASQDIERIERLVTESGHVKGQSAVASLQALIGDLVTIRPGNADGSEMHVSCCDHGVFSILNHIQDEAQAGQHTSRLSFATPEAHLLASDVCMKICSATTLRLAHVHDNSTDSSLIIYAWNYWSTHLSSSGFQLSNQDVASRFNEMATRVCTDASMFLSKPMPSNNAQS